MSLSFKINLSLLLLFCNIQLYSQDTSIISLSDGNIWIYNLIITHSSKPTQEGLQIKKIIGDTTFNNNQYKIIQVNTYNIPDMSTYYEYWRTDNNCFYISDQSIEERCVYSNAVFSDSSWLSTYREDTGALFSVNFEQDTIFGISAQSQSWSVDWHFPTSPTFHYDTTTCIKYVGPIQSINDYSWDLGSDWGWEDKKASLTGAIIDRNVYGDTTITSIDDKRLVFNNIKPTNFLLFHNYPNPFNPTTIIKYSIPESGFVTVKVYDVLGREIAVLVNEFKPTGAYEFKFDGSNLSSGVYLYRIISGSFIDTKKMVLSK